MYIKTIAKGINVMLIAGVIGWGIIVVSFTHHASNAKHGKKVLKERIVYKENVPVIHEVIGTLYNPVAGQCDSSPLITADNSKINLNKLAKEEIRWVALSRDLLARWGGPYNYGDTLRVHHPNKKIRGLWVVHDTMNRRYRKRIDFLVHGKTKFPGKSPHILISNIDYYVSRD